MFKIFKKSNCDVCNRKIRKYKLITISGVNFCCYTCYDRYLRSLDKDEWLEFFKIARANCN